MFQNRSCYRLFHGRGLDWILIFQVTEMHEQASFHVTSHIEKPQSI